MLIPCSLPHRIRDSPVLMRLRKYEADWNVPYASTTLRSADMRICILCVHIILLREIFVKIYNMQLLPKACRNYITGHGGDKMYIKSKFGIKIR